MLPPMGEKASRVVRNRKSPRRRSAARTAGNERRREEPRPAPAGPRRPIPPAPRGTDPPKSGEWLFTTREGAEGDLTDELYLAGVPDARIVGPSLVVAARAPRPNGRVE